MRPSVSLSQPLTLYAPSYSATSSPIRNTRSSLANSSSIAEFSASRQVISAPRAGPVVERALILHNLTPKEEAEAARVRVLHKVAIGNYGRGWNLDPRPMGRGHLLKRWRPTERWR